MDIVYTIPIQRCKDEDQFNNPRELRGLKILSEPDTIMQTTRTTGKSDPNQGMDTTKSTRNLHRIAMHR